MEKEITINGQEYILKSEIETPKNKGGLKAVLVRSYAAGIHFGYLLKEEFTQSGKVVTLVNTRRVWYWDGAASISQMALTGVTKPENCKFSVEIAENEIVNVIETLPLTKKALNNLYGVKVWEQK